MITPSICIPSVSKRIKKREIKSVFIKLGWGEISHIHIYDKTEHNQIFIDFKKWFLNNEDIKSIYNTLISNNTIKIVYDFPWFWKCSASFYNKKTKKYNRFKNKSITDDDLLQRKRLNQKLNKNLKN